MIHYVIVEPRNGKLELSGVPLVYSIGELVPEARPELAGAAPILYCAEHPNEQLPALRERAEQGVASDAPPVICAIVECDKASNRLQRHLANRMVLPKPAEGTAIFRFYDPRVFAHLRWILKPEQLGALMGPVARWTYLDREAGWVTVEGEKAPNDAFAVTEAQYKQMARIDVVERALDALRSNGAATKSGMPSLVDAQLAKGEIYGLSGSDLLAFALHGTVVSPYFDLHPRVRTVLQAPEKHPYAETVAGWTQGDWETIARESIQYQWRLYRHRFERDKNMAYDFDFSNIAQLTTTAMQAPTRESGSCNMCKKKGLPILPVRYSVFADTKAHSATGAMRLMGGKFGEGVTNIALKKAKYTLRTVRYGYVYVFYPKTGRWQAYAVTAEGYLYEYPLDMNIDRTLEQPCNCHQAGHAQLAQCITIEDAQKAGVVYIAFSEERWTKKVRDTYATNFMGCRDKRMQKFDAAGWFNGNTQQPHTEGVTRVADLLSEYKGSPPEALASACFPYHNRAGQGPALKKAMDSITPDKGLVFALWDPVGITQELNFEQRLAFGAALEPYEHGIWATSAIDALHEAVVASAKEDVESGARLMEANTYQGLGATAIFDGGKLLEKQLKSIEEMKKADLVSGGPEAWKPYTTHYRQQAIVDFKEKMATALKQEQTSTLVPLSQDHQAWLTSPALLNVFQFDYEQGNCRSGVNYTNTFTGCIEGAADRKETVDALVKWAKGDVTDTRNPLLRALVLNHPVLAEKVKEASSYPYVELREFVAKLIESYSKIEEVEKRIDPSLSRALAGSVAHFLQQAGGPIVEAVSSGVDAAAAKVICAAMCMRTKKLFEFKALWGSPNQWVHYIARQMQEMMPGRQQIDVQDLQTKLHDKAAPAGAKDYEVKVKQFVPVQSAADEAAALSSVKGTPTMSKQMAVSTLTPDVVENIYMPKFRLMARGEPGFAGIGAIFNAINLRLARAELKKSNRFNATENGIKFDNAVAGLVASVAQYGGSALDQLAKGGVDLSERLAGFGRFLRIVGRYAGAVVGLVSVAIDAYHAWEEFEHSNFLMLALYTTSAVVGTCLVAAAFAGNVLTLPLLIFAAVVGVLINYFKGREVYDWLEQCFFGVKPKDERFERLDEDQKAFSAIFS